jgi:RNA polymerase sigma factor (sigma-70 family)
MPGNKEQLSAIYITRIDQYQNLIYKICSIYAGKPEDRKDLFQEIVMQGWISFPRFKENSKFTTWLYRVAINTALNYKRREQKLRIIDGAIIPELEDNLSPIEKEQYNLMYEVIDKLPGLEKAIILLHLDNLSYNEIAEIMGMTVSNVGSKLSRIREKLKKQIQPTLQKTN